ncbi:MAG TPA: primosomal protein N' [Longimicrobiales bacterium]
MLVDVALPLPVPRTFTYLAPGERIAPGTRVRVPFSGRRLVGWVVGEATVPKDMSRLKQVERVLENEPSVPADLLALCRWIAEYYCTPLGIVLRAALPAALSDNARLAPPVKTRQVLQIIRPLESLQQRDTVFGRAQRQREGYEAVEAAGGRMDVSHLTSYLGFSASVLRALVDKGLASITEERVLRDPFADTPPPPPTSHSQTADQFAALAALRAAAVARDPQPFLLFGVTGSGKTLVYIELLRTVVKEQGRGAIVLVPEISLTPQTVARFRAEFGDVIAVLHSALSDGERYDAWRALHDGDRRIAIGARSAIFAPVRDLGAIIVDEEHESSYKQSESPRYHAREVAVVRAREAGAVCVLGSATPALESWSNVLNGKYGLLELPARVEGRPLPPVHVIDVRTGERGGRSFDILSAPLVAAIQERLERREQVILLLNRRGYASFMQCRSCGHVWQCADCNVSLTYHRGRRRLVCHYCSAEHAIPSQCDQCRSTELSHRGVGTEQVERHVAEVFPHARIARMDVDTTSAKWSHHDILERVGAAEIDILLGTQMIAKGLDFPNVTLVGVVNADVAMNLPDFRASERTFQLLTQVAGRAGRGPKGGDVFVQTALPHHYAIKAAVQHDYRTYAERELSERMGPGYPPHTRMANIIISGTDEIAVQEAAEHLAGWIEDLVARHAVRDLLMTGPAPCPVDRIRGRWRWHVLIRSGSPGPLGATCREIQYRYALPSSRAELRLVLDRDPVSLL